MQNYQNTHSSLLGREQKLGASFIFGSSACVTSYCWYAQAQCAICHCPETALVDASILSAVHIPMARCLDVEAG